jgi:pimeloyl-ACP methyl ester carboxylesterase
VRLRHGRVEIELHARRQGPGPALLLLHALGGSAADWGPEVDVWPGPVHALDFSGHGRSGWVRGGSYAPELLAGDADAALAALGGACLCGAGVGAYVALLVSGARPDAVPAALLLPGAGLDGGGALPDFDAPLAAGEPLPPGCDPALRRLAQDVRPVDYAAPLGESARRLVFAEDGGLRPPWWTAARRRNTKAETCRDLADGLARLAAAQ